MAFIAKREQLLSTTSDIAEKHTAVCDEVSPGKERLESVVLDLAASILAVLRTKD